jgi:POT family proton-dependent oligopeptide transporter
MTTSAEPTGTPKWEGPKSDKQFLGHPVGLFVLFFTEMWERFSYYGMRGLLKLYMVNYLFITIRQTYQGKAYDGTGNPDDVLGWGFVRSLLPKVDIADPQIVNECIVPAVKRLTAGDTPVALEMAQRIAAETCAVSPNASVLYGWYTGLVYLTPLLGGYLADKYLGQKRAVFIGGTIMALGQFILFGMESMFFVGLCMLIIGNGFFKPNISTQVGNLYPPGDARRDGAFTIFYMGINLGAFLCNFVCGTLAAGYGWRYGFLAAGIGMCTGLVVQVFGQKYLAPDTLQRRASAGPAVAAAPVKQPLTQDERGRVIALIILCALNIVFWAVYEQQGNTMQTWADEQTNWPNVLGFQVPATWFQSANPFFIFAFAPFFDMFWRWQNKKGAEPSSVAKMAIGCIILGLSFIVMIIGAKIVGADKGSWFWPVFCTMLLTIGELYLSPIGLSLVTKVSPVRIVSMMMGMWFLSSFFGNILSGYIGRLYTSMPKEGFFGVLMVLGIAAGLAIWAFNKKLKTAMGANAN